MKVAALLTEIIDHFANAKESPGDWWAHDDEFSSYCLDHQARDGTKFWLDLDKDGTITLLWKPAGKERPEIIKFVAPNE
jgi:hypothetical protein